MPSPCIASQRPAEYRSKGASHCPQSRRCCRSRGDPGYAPTRTRRSAWDAALSPLARFAFVFRPAESERALRLRRSATQLRPRRALRPQGHSSAGAGPDECRADRGIISDASLDVAHTLGVRLLATRRSELGRIGRRSPSSRKGGLVRRACARRRYRNAADRCAAAARGSARGGPRWPGRRNRRSTRVARSAGFREGLDRHRELLEEIQVVLG